MVNAAQLIEVVIEPKTESERAGLWAALAELAAEDLSFRFSADEECGRLIVKGLDERHLDNKFDKLKREYRLDLTIGQPQIIYRETIKTAADVDYTHKRRVGAEGEFARVAIRVEPLPSGAGVAFQNEADHMLAEQYYPAIRKGFEAALEKGPVAGFPVTDVKVTLRDGAYHPVDSSPLSFEIAARAGVQEGLRKARPALLEPLMDVEVTAPTECSDGIVADLIARRGAPKMKIARDNVEVIIAIVPLANLLGYEHRLAALSGGLASYTMRFSNYAPSPSPGDEPFPPAAAMRA
jgi:elongation factor G